ncbi:hypothetical protein B0I35DRAFT_407997 [Stachybotrys elegans]|uniref:Uncharacterized protein n=1 Tax=Stachybotrys elegans TaxID=80388 RepID=A0A8K0SQ34_9HYPO|nr:hypothetical protein B0I35DRAFT_407997 [Stachybotrys elegans]
MMGRRTTVVPRRRKPTFAELFTACYSSILASAAVVDAIRKEDRRQDLDRQLEKAREDLRSVRDEAASLHTLPPASLEASAGSSSDTQLSEHQQNGLRRAIYSIVKSRPFMKEIYMPAGLSSSPLLRHVRLRNLASRSVEGVREDYKNHRERIISAIHAEERNTTIRQRNPQTDRHIDRAAESTRELVYQLLKRAHQHDRRIPAAAKRGDDAFLKNPAFVEVIELARENYPHYTPRPSDPAMLEDEMSGFNKRLRHILNSQHHSLSQKIATICFNMFVARHPPNIHTYNSLVVCLSSFRDCTSLAEAVCNSFSYKTVLCPTPSTFSAILGHYEKSYNAGRFIRTLARISGLDDTTGAKVGRRHVNDIIDSPDQHDLAANRLTYPGKGDWVYSVPEIDAGTTESVIRGLLTFKLYALASRLFMASLRLQIRLDEVTIHRLFDNCLATLDRDSAAALVRGFATVGDWPTMIRRIYSDAMLRYITLQLYGIMDFCGLYHEDSSQCSVAAANSLGIPKRQVAKLLHTLYRVSKPSKNKAFDQAIQKVRTHMRTDRLQSRLYQIEGLMKTVRGVQNRTFYIKDALLRETKGSPGFNISLTRYLCQDAEEISMKLNQEFIDLFKPQSALILQTCEELNEELEDILPMGGGLGDIDVDRGLQVLEEYNLRMKYHHPPARIVVYREAEQLLHDCERFARGETKSAEEPEVVAVARDSMTIAAPPKVEAATYRRYRSGPAKSYRYPVSATRTHLVTSTELGVESNVIRMFHDRLEAFTKSFECVREGFIDMDSTRPSHTDSQMLEDTTMEFLSN